MPLTQPLQVLHLGLSTEAAREPYCIQHPPGQGHTSCVRYPPPSVPYQEQEAAEGHAEVRRKGFQRYQIKFNSSPLSVVLSIPPSRVLSALAFWSPVFGEADYLPHLAFPFAKLFQNNRLLAFEMLATILSKCQTTLVVLSDQVLPSTAVAFEQALCMCRFAYNIGHKSPFLFYCCLCTSCYTTCTALCACFPPSSLTFVSLPSSSPS